MTHTTRFNHLAALLTVACVTISMGVAGTAGATNYYVGPSGSDANSGTSAAAPWATIGKANATLRAGDVVRIADGTYSGAIQPASSGSSITNRITYIGNLADPSRVTVSDLSLNKSFITVKGVTSTGGAGFNYPALYDSVARSIVRGVDMSGAKYCIVTYSTVNGTILFAANGSSCCISKGVVDPGCIANSDSDTLRGNQLNIGTALPGARAFKFCGFSQRCVVDSNTIIATLDPTPGGDTIGILCSFNSYAQTFRDNRWVIEATADDPNDNSRCVTLRDSTHDYLWQRDTILVGMQSNHRVNMMLSNSGDYPGTTRRNTFDGCFIKLATGMIFTQDTALELTIKNSVIATGSDHVFWALGATNGFTMDHNTIYTTTTNQALRFDGVPTGPVSLTSNIIYSRNAAAAGTYGASVGFPSTVSNVSSDYNVFFSPNYTSKPGDRSVQWCCYTASNPGTGTPWYAKSGQDGHSRYGSPRWADSTLATFDPRLLTGSAALGAGAGGTNAGITPPGPDLVAPAAIADLDSSMTTDKSVVLKWTGTGDDGTVGRPVAYDLRMATAPITSANFTSATAVLPSPATTTGGTKMSYFVSGLTAGTTYYFAIKAQDEAGNWSGLSNVRRVDVAAQDQISPGAVKDLVGK